MTLLVREAEVERLVRMADVITALDDAERACGEGRAVQQPRSRVRLPNGMLHFMAGTLVSEGVVGFKEYTRFGRGPVRFKIFLFSTETGVLDAIIEGNRLGQLRTGAATAVAARRLARADAETVGIIGTGFQAEGQIEALACGRKLRLVRAFGRDPERRRAFCEKMSRLTGVPVEPADSARAAVTGADIVVTATTSREPVLEGEWLVPGTFVAAIGANLLIRREIDGAVFKRAAHIVVDSIAQARVESGALMAATDTGQLRWEQIEELRELCAGRRPGRTDADQITLFHSLGSVLWDLASGWVALRAARAAGAGVELPME